MPFENAKYAQLTVILKDCLNLSLLKISPCRFRKSDFFAKKVGGIASFFSKEFYLFSRSLSKQYPLCGK